MVMRANEPRHEIYALALADGSIESGWPVDVATALKGSFIPPVQNERGALALFAGRVYVPYSGHYGDAATITASSSAFPRPIRPRSRASRPGRAAAAFGGKAESPATGNRCSLRPATRSTRARGAMAKPSCGSALASPARSIPRDYFAPSNWALSRSAIGTLADRPDSARRSERQRRSKAHVRRRQVWRRLPARPR